LRQAVIKNSILLLIGLLFWFWLTRLSNLDIPEFIGNIPISGLILLGLFIAVVILLQKELLKTTTELTITKLTLLSSLTCFISETLFHLFRILYQDIGTLTDKLYYFTISSVYSTLFGTALAFLIAFQLKTKKTRQLILLIVVFLLIVSLIQYFRQ
jgi:hypothetical protein